MKQDLMGHSIAQLEAALAASFSNEEMLRHLEDELRYRLAPPALALLVSVQAALRRAMASKGATTDSAPRLVPTSGERPDVAGWHKHAMPGADSLIESAQAAPAAPTSVRFPLVLVASSARKRDSLTEEPLTSDDACEVRSAA